MHSNGNEDFSIIGQWTDNVRQWTDKVGIRHTHLRQTINGLNVYGSAMILHDAQVGTKVQTDNASISGVLATNNESVMRMLSVKGNSKNSKAAVAIASKIGDVNGNKAELSYVYLPELQETKLAWKMEVSWEDCKTFGRDFVFVDANTEEVLTRHPQVHSALSRRTYTLNGDSAQQAPGSLVCVDNQSCGSTAGGAAQRAHDGAADVYNYYKNYHNCDSLYNAGMTLVSSVDMGIENAYWTGSQMIYGRAGNFVDYDFANDLDVIAHEFTHGVISNTANMTYRNESGALNKAWADIFGITVESRTAGQSSSSCLALLV